jgi:hypothetical protein
MVVRESTSAIALLTNIRSLLNDGSLLRKDFCDEQSITQFFGDTRVKLQPREKPAARFQ